jgi:RNA polymerase sigma-70 factor (ECF subfamily)
MAMVRPNNPHAETPQPGSLVDLFHTLEAPLLHYAQRFLNDPAQAEDAVQEAFVRLQQQFHQVRDPRAWLYRTVHNLALNEQRKAGKGVPLVRDAGDGEVAAPDLTDPQPLPDEQIARLEGIGLVRLSVGQLDARSREVIELKFLENLSYREISQRTGLSVGHVGYLLHHTLKSLAAELAKSGLIP